MCEGPEVRKGFEEHEVRAPAPGPESVLVDIRLGGSPHRFPRGASPAPSPPQLHLGYYIPCYYIRHTLLCPRKALPNPAQSSGCTGNDPALWKPPIDPLTSPPTSPLAPRWSSAPHLLRPFSVTHFARPPFACCPS